MNSPTVHPVALPKKNSSPLKIIYIGFDSIHSKRCAEWFARRGHKVWMLTNRNIKIEDVAIFNVLEDFKGSRWARLPYLKINSAFFRYFHAIIRIVNIVKGIKPDIIHLHTIFFFGSYGSLFFNFPLVITPWNGDVIWKKNKSLFHKLISKRIVNKAKIITSDNRVMKHALVKSGIPPRKIRIIGWWGTDLEIFKPHQINKQIKDKLGIDNCPAVISTRNLAKEYNVDVLIRAIPLVLNEVHNTKFLFLWYFANIKKELECLIDRLKVSNAVRWIGRVPYDELPYYYCLSNVAVSICSPDSTPTTLAEAMACGVPLIVSNERSITEFIENGKNGIVIPPQDVNALAERIIWVLRNKEQCEQFVEYNLDMVKEIGDYEQEMKKVERIYYFIIEN